MPEQLAAGLAWQGIDVLLDENVGGKVFDAVLLLLNTAARELRLRAGERLHLPACRIGPDRLAAADGDHPQKSASGWQGFIIGRQDYGHRIAGIPAADAGRWGAGGEIKYREQS